MRVLDARRIPYTALTYDDSIHSGAGVAQALGVPVGQVFKTLVVLRDRGRPLLAIIPSDRELDLKRMAAAAGEKRVRMATQREAEAKTGLLVGGISALALLDRGFEVLLDDAARQFDELYVSAGQRGINLRLRVDDLIAVTRASVAAVS
ncbi:MAG TPA: aminoacyl-tRNA deacylase [Herpetosiphonaceae bacterium]